uniref:SUMO specific peptidase 7 n=1 Tax=Amazona collaria TaxID=241587 RepID=A0A8B9J017_9PSIT
VYSRFKSGHGDTSLCRINCNESDFSAVFMIYCYICGRQPKVILTNVLRTKIGRKYIDSHVIIDANLSAAAKLQSGQLPSSSIASLQTCQILNSPHESCFLSERYVTADFAIVLSSDDEDRPSEPECTELLQNNITDSKETDPQSDFSFSAKQLEVKMESHTEEVLHFLAYVLLCQPFISSIWLFKILFSTVALNKNINLTVDTLDLRRFGMWRSDGGCSSTTIIFLWLSVDYVEKIEIQLGKLVMSKPSKSSEFVFLELSQPLSEWEEDRLTEVITGVSKKNRAPDLLEFLSLKEALSLFKDLSPKESSFINYSKDLLKGCVSCSCQTPLGDVLLVARPCYALANKQNDGCYSISLSSALNEEWKEVRETGAVKNLIIYPPPPAKGGLGVTREDLECLEYGEFLNDVIIDFYLKYLLLEKVPKHLADRTHIFSSFFYKCLTRTEKNSEVAQRRHRRVKTWTRHINIFSKDYIFVPVNEESHWYIAVICFPRLEAAVYEECPHQSLLCHQPQQSPLWSESENTRTGSMLCLSFDKKVCLEWEAKRKMHREFSKSTMIDLYPRVPKQDNSSDCGIYLLQYVESFFENPIVNFEEPLHLEKWFPRQLIRSKREEIRDLILQLHFQQHSGSSS